MGFGNANASRGGGGNFRGASRGGGGTFGRGGGRGAPRGGGRGGFNRRQEDEGPPEYVEQIAEFSHLYEDGIVCRITHEKIPYFNAPIYLENKEQIGKVDEVFGQLADPHFNLKLMATFKNDTFKKDSKFYISPFKLLTKDRLIPQPRTAGARGADRGGRGGAGRGSFGGDRGRGGRGSFGGDRGRGGRGSFGGDRSRGGNNNFRGEKRSFNGDSRGGNFAKAAKFE